MIDKILEIDRPFDFVVVGGRVATGSWAYNHCKFVHNGDFAQDNLGRNELVFSLVD